MPKSRIRPDPVSCEFCRTKKLKCSRVQPCSNCIARGIVCNFLVPPSKKLSADCDNPLITSRIERLEALVASLQAQSRAESEPSWVSASATPHYPSHLGSEKDELLNEEVGNLENIGVRDDTLLSDLSSPLEFKIRDISEFLDSSNNEPDKLYLRGEVWLPPYDKANSLLQIFETKLLSLCPVVHIPTTRSLLRVTYLRLKEPTLIMPSSVALLLSIFALAAFFCDPSSIPGIVLCEADSIALSKAFTRYTLDVLDHSRRSSSGNLEDAQAYILTSLVLSYIDGFSARSRMLFSSASSVARDLRLHRMDEYDCSEQRPNDTRLTVETEMKRRVFWYIASDDWLQSTISGPQEGTYLMQNSFIKVRLPRDCTDDELTLGGANDGTTTDAPTHMGVFLERIRLAHICREITDTIPLDVPTLLQIPYERVITLDQKLETFLATISRPLQYHCPNRDVLESIYPQLPAWRYCITKAALSRRWKLNQAFLSRQNLDPRYEYSRRACVESAHKVIRGYTALSEQNKPSSILTKLGTAVHFTHLALTILIKDLCFNRRQPSLDAAQTKNDIETAFRVFAEAKTVSPLLAKSIASLKTVLQRSEVNMPEASFPHLAHDDGDAGNSSNQTRSTTTLEEQTTPPPPPPPPPLLLTPIHATDESTDADFDTFWNMALQSESGVDLDDWDHIFSALDTRPI